MTFAFLFELLLEDISTTKTNLIDYFHKSLSQLNALPVPYQDRFMLKGFWSISRVPRGSSDESGFEVDFKTFWEGSWRPSWRQVGPKLAQKWSNIGKKSVFWGFRCQLLFVDAFL